MTAGEFYYLKLRRVCVFLFLFLFFVALATLFHKNLPWLGVEQEPSLHSCRGISRESATISSSNRCLVVLKGLGEKVDPTTPACVCEEHHLHWITEPCVVETSAHSNHCHRALSATLHPSLWECFLTLFSRSPFHKHLQGAVAGPILSSSAAGLRHTPLLSILA